MRHILLNLRLMILVLLTAATPAWAQVAADAPHFIEERAHTVLALFNNNALSPDQREDRLREIVTASFDVPTISRFVLGRYWATATPAERKDFTRLFEHYQVHIYATLFAQYPDSKVKMKGERPEANNRTLVRSEIAWRGSQQPAKVDWWVKKTDDRFKIIDVSVDGISQLVTLRDEFSSVIQQHDGQVAGLIEHLKEKTGG
ncbi:MAG TPA: ABC transporter substrate-binding protein [Stellaceae bacterium]|nr:ABC transporter substrate-binding protein [Stellaceae bacterium]